MTDRGAVYTRVSIERDTITRVNGAEVRTPAIIARPWARFEYLSGNELWKAQQVNSTVTARARVGYCWAGKILPSDRLIYRDKHLEIKAVIPDEQGRDVVTLELKG